MEKRCGGEILDLAPAWRNTALCALRAAGITRAGPTEEDVVNHLRQIDGIHLIVGVEIRARGRTRRILNILPSKEDDLDGPR